MTDFSSDKYKEYLVDQENDNNVIMPETINRYMDFLTDLIGKQNPIFNYKSDDQILDVGARAFETWDYFISKYAKKITGIDIGKEGLEYCLRTGKTGMIELDAHKMFDLLDRESYKLVIALHSLEHMYDLPLVLSNCYEALEDDGYFFFALPVPSFNWGKGHWYDVPDVDAMMKMCKDAGFSKPPLHCQLYSDYRFRPEQEMVCLLQK